MNFRYVTDKKDIQGLLKNATGTEIGKIWQTQVARRDVYSVRSIEINVDKLNFKTDSPFDLLPNVPVHFFINNRNFIFKHAFGSCKTSLTNLWCEYPKTAKALEERLHPRFQFPSDSIKITLKTISTRITHYATASLKDISKFGFSVSWSSFNKEYFKQNDYYKIVKINNKDIFEQAMFYVAHVSEDSDQSEVKVGFCSDGPFLEKFQQQLFGSL